MREARDGLKCFPEAGWSRQDFDIFPDRFDRVALAEDGMPLRHETAGFGEQQEEDPVDHDERLVSGSDPIRFLKVLQHSPLAPRRDECPRERHERLLYAVLERTANGYEVLFGNGDRAIECRLTVRGREDERRGAKQSPHGRKRRVVLGNRVQVEFEKAP